ncbi:MAG: DUF1385 domain-containing protein [Oscillospiraceae bacterium]|nr:DUF1385 domain-containing protein [Oscillospiraceae bacterium]
MENKQQTQEKFKTMIGGQALIEGIMMRGPKLDAIATRDKAGIHVETTPRTVRSKKSVLSWPLIRGAVNFFDAQVVGVKALLRSADLSPEENQSQPSKLDIWLEKKLGNKKFQSFLVGTAVALGLGMSVLLFFLLPNFIGGIFDRWVANNLLRNLIEGIVRIIIFIAYILLVSRMEEMKRVFSYHGAEHKTIRCYEAQLPLTVENIRVQTRKHPRCGTSFLFVVMVLSILVFSVASSCLLAIVPSLEAIRGSLAYSGIMFGFKLLMLPLVVAISYEINRLVGRYDNWLTRILTAPGQWFQNFTTNEPDDSMIEVAIAALEAVIPEHEGEDRW